MTKLDAYYQARDFLLAALSNDLVGSAADEELQEPPLDRFIAGILYPQESNEAVEDVIVEDEEMATGRDSVAEPVDTPVSLSHVRFPSACGLSFSVPESTTHVTVHVSAARYEDRGTHWQRQGIARELELVVDKPGESSVEVAPGLRLTLVSRSRREGARPITLALVNTNQIRGGLKDSLSWFQPQITVICPDGFLDRPTTHSPALDDQEIASNNLLFRKVRNLGVGHGCAINWTDADIVTQLRTTFIPSYEVAATDTGIEGVSLRMADFSAGSGAAGARDLITRYEGWIRGNEREILTLPDHLKPIARVHMDAAATAAQRMRAGLDYLETHQDADRAFRLMNQAMYDQRNKQEFLRTGATEQQQFWRPFQLAFILMNLEDLSEPQSENRDVADLLWFPTGGGKTEAYLGLVAYTILLRRLRNPHDGGVSVLMRYTLRLLTLQQFERAAGLICSLELIRRRELSDSMPISLGLWVGQKATPNNLRDARDSLKKLMRGEPVESGNPLQLTRCPWSGHRLTPADYLVGQDKMEVRCPSPECEFHSGLPVHLLDDDVYAARPSLVIGTVDKFALMAWKGQSQTLFSSDGANPSPDLIIQDELHLISGPLGTMVGLYETAVDAATSRTGRPKLIASTATIRRATEQVNSVFSRTTRQFPPPGLNANDSFFSTAAKPADKATRLYVGVMAPGSSHTYLLVRTYAALLQAGQDLDASDEVRDAYWTLVGYFNSLRVLGGAYIQVTDDVPTQMRVIAGRRGTNERGMQEEPSELTSRVPSSQIPAMLKALETSFPDPASPDVVLATNMISVGLDVDRLGLMAVMGQPQATAEYIQATSRVGRKFPGLVVTIYNSNRSRDLSHYESFSTYHRSLYRQVEPNSATPFSPRARDRGLHGALVSMARMTVMGLNPDAAAGQVAAYGDELQAIVEQIVDRARRVAPDQELPTRRQLQDLLQKWQDAPSIGPLKYAGWHIAKDVLLVPAGETVSSDKNEPAFPVDEAPWATLTSLRDVDAVSTLFLVRRKETSK